jgi:hypothetical protein
MYCIRFLIFIITIALSPVTMAQEPSVDELKKTVQASKEEATALRGVATQLKTQNEDLRKRVEGKEAALWDHFYKAKESEYDFQIEMMNVNARSFQHQNVASYVILALVVFVVGGGLYFAHIQLMAGLQPITNFATGVQPAAPAPVTGAVLGPVAGNAGPVVPAANANVPLGTTTLAAEIGKVTVTSSVVGVIVLVISLAFLYIYTREVYHIQVVDPFRPMLKDPVQADPPTKGGPPPKQ